MIPISIVVFGPKGCGKTTNAERLRLALHMDTIWDEGKEPPKAEPPHIGALILTTNPSKYRQFVSIRFEDAMSFSRPRPTKPE